MLDILLMKVLDIVSCDSSPNARCNLSYSAGRPHVSVQNFAVPSGAMIDNVRTHVQFYAGNRDWEADNASISLYSNFESSIFDC